MRLSESSLARAESFNADHAPRQFTSRIGRRHTSRGIRQGKLLSVIMAIGLTWVVSCRGYAADGAKGLWPMPQKNACNTSRADVPAHMKTAPSETWAYGYDAEDFVYIRPVTIDKKTCYLAQVAYGLQLIKPNGDTVWRQPNIGLIGVKDIYTDPGTGKPMALLQCGTAILRVIDVSNGKIIWKWQIPEKAYLGGIILLQRTDRIRFITFPVNSGYGRCYQITPASPIPQLLWETDIHDRCSDNFGPNIAAADMNRDGSEEIVIAGKPAYFGVIDQDTGRILFDLHYDHQVVGAEQEQKGRPYGILEIADIDGDGYPDVVMVSKNVEQYIGVARNIGGKELRLAWSKWVSLDFPDEQIKLRFGIEALPDLRGDGKRELIVSMFNEDNDGRWKTVVFDGLLGYDKRLAELMDRYLVGCYDINDDGVQEIITSPETSPDPLRSTLIAVDGRTFKDIASVNASPSNCSTELPLNVGVYTSVERPLVISRSDGSNGIVVSEGETDKVWRIVDGKSVTEPLGASVLARKILDSEGTGMLRDRTVDIPARKKISGIAAGGPLVSMFSGTRELILARSDGTIIGGPPNLAENGTFQESWVVKGIMPTVWIDPNGRRIVCAVDPDRTKVYLYEPKYQPGDDAPITTISPPHWVKEESFRGTSGLMPYGDNDFRILVGMQIGSHAVASAVYDLSGNIVWEDKNTGPYPRSPAADDLYGSGKMNVMMDNHGMELIFDETGKKKMFAYGWSLDIPERHDGAKYVLPIIGPFGHAGEKRILLSSGLDSVETVDVHGNRISKIDLESCYIMEWSCSSVAKIRPDAWDFAMIDKFGRFSCVEIETSKLRWTLDLSFAAHLPSVITTADLDGDGRDNFLLSTSTGDLIAVDEKDGKGFVMWKKRFDAPLRQAFVADVNGDGTGEVVMEFTNGFVRILK